MRYVIIPPPQKPDDEDGEPIESAEGLTFDTYMRKYVLRDQRMGATMAHLTCVLDVRDRLKEANGVLELHDNEWALLVPVVREPGVDPQFARPVLAMCRAIIDAKTTKPNLESDGKA